MPSSLLSWQSFMCLKHSALTATKRIHPHWPLPFQLSSLNSSSLLPGSPFPSNEQLPDNQHECLHTSKAHHQAMLQAGRLQLAQAYNLCHSTCMNPLSLPHEATLASIITPHSNSTVVTILFFPVIVISERGASYCACV